MSEYGVLAGREAVRFERLLPGPVERVWAHLTEPELRARWLAGGPMELRVGGAVRLEFRHGDLSSVKEPTPERFREYREGAIEFGRVTRCEPPRLLSHTWGEEGGYESEVTYELRPRGEQVLLVLTHRRLRTAGTLIDVASGWHAHLAILDDVLGGREPRPFWATHEAAEAEYRRRLGEP